MDTQFIAVKMILVESFATRFEASVRVDGGGGLGARTRSSGQWRRPALRGDHLLCMSAPVRAIRTTGRAGLHQLSTISQSEL